MTRAPTSVARSRGVVVGFWVAFALVSSCPAASQSVDVSQWVTNGQVNAVARAGTTVYLGGSFTQVGPATGGGAPIGAASGAPLSTFSKILGTVRAAVPDGSGGWYVGGTFASVGGQPRGNLAHILSDGSLDTWNPDANGTVHALALEWPLVYVGGSFTTVAGQPRNRIAAVHAASGAILSWNPNANQTVFAIGLGNATVYLGGDFTSIGASARNYVAAVDSATGVAASWNPGANSRVRTITLDVGGGTVYAGGDFTLIGGQPRGYAAAINAATGVVGTWNPNAGLTVHVLLAGPGNKIYAGGDFTSIGGQPRNRIAVLDANTGAATAWNPDAGGPVSALALGGTRIYAGGSFRSIGNRLISRIAAIDTASGTVVAAWEPNPNDPVLAVAASGASVYAGGSFTSVGGVLRNGLAALDATSGVATAWNPDVKQVGAPPPVEPAPAGNVRALAVAGSRVYIGGAFDSVGTQARSDIAAIDATTGEAISWNPNANDEVRALAVSGAVVYAGGAFTAIGGQSRSRIAALDVTTGAATAWNPNANAAVYALALSGSTLYAGGAFTTIGGLGRDFLAALSTATGAASFSWSPDPDGDVVAVAVDGSTVYAGGNFTNVGRAARNGLAGLNTTNGDANAAWNPQASSSSATQAIALSGTTVYAGGTFTSIGGQARNRIAALDAADALATAWNPNANQFVFALAVSGAAVYVGGRFTAIGGAPQSNFAAIPASPAVSAVHPGRGGDTAPITVTVLGSGLPSGATVALSRSGQPDIPGTGVAVAPDGLSLSAIFDLAGAALGSWDVTVTTPDLQVATLSGGFAVEPASAHQVRVDVIGPALMRPNRPKAFDLVIENLGNSDLLSVPLWISRIPPGATLTLGSPLAPPPQSDGEPDWNLAPTTLTGPAGQYVPVVIPRLPPGITVRRVFLAVPDTVASLEFDAALTPPWADGAAFRNCLSNAGVITDPACMGVQLTAIDAYLATTPGIEALSGIGLWAKIAWQCEGAGDLAAAVARAEQVLGLMLAPVEGTGVAPGCADVLLPHWQDRRLVGIVMAVDPNDKLGPQGYGPAGQIALGQSLTYSIRFENDPALSTVPAQNVLVTDDLDAATLDLSQLSLEEIRFGRRADGTQWVLLPPPGVRTFDALVDLRPEMGLKVRVSVSYDQAIGRLSWAFTSLDATTEGPPGELDGFLPPNVTATEGEGSVMFKVTPRADVVGGAMIRNRATITFDEGAPKLTPWAENTIDDSAPESHVLPLLAYQYSETFTVRWEEMNPEGDLHDYSVFVSEDGGPYQEWLRHTPATEGTFSGRGHHYAFYSRAQDASGNMETPPPLPDAETTSLVAVDRGPGLTLRLEGTLPNPSVDGAQVWFTLPSDERAVLEAIDAAGRRVARREVGALGPGRHSVDLSAALRRPGVYLLRLAQGGRTLQARVVVIR